MSNTYSAGERAALFVGPVPEDKLPKDATFGRTLTGTLALGKADGGAKGGDAPGNIQLSYWCAPPNQAPFPT